MEEDFGVKRNKRKLESIRNGRQDKQLPRDNSTSTIGSVPGAAIQDQPNVRFVERDGSYASTSGGRIEDEPTIIRRSDSEQRYAEPTDVNTTEGDGRANEPSRKSPLTEEEIERQRELGRQRTQRYRDRQRETSDIQAQNRYSDVSFVTPKGDEKVKFNLKGLFAGNAKEPVKLFTKTQAENALEDMVAVYTKITSLGDDLLEIIVNDHEPVQIWEDEDTARMFATMHLQAAQKSVEAARVAYALLRLKDKFFIGMYFLTRMKASHAHIVAHGGFSFK
jgi:hypothetical protein